MPRRYKRRRYICPDDMFDEGAFAHEEGRMWDHWHRQNLAGAFAHENGREVGSSETQLPRQRIWP